MSYGFVYLTTNIVNGRQYVGRRSGDPSASKNKNYRGSGTVFSQAFRKYGSDSFTREVLAVCHSEKELQETEQKFLDLFDAANNPKFYNVNPVSVGFGSGPRGPQTPEHKANNAAARKGWSPSLEWREKQSRARRGKPANISPEGRARIVASRQTEYSLVDPSGNVHKILGRAKVQELLCVPYSRVARFLDGIHEEVNGWRRYVA
jgi:hypothetical protein